MYGAEVDIELIQVADSTFACLQLEGGLGASNSGYVNIGGGLVVDSFWDLPRTRELIRLYGSVGSTEIGRLVNTHHNGDHAWGNQLFAEAGTEIIGHRLCAEYFATESPEGLLALSRNENLPPQMAGLASSLRRFDFEGIVLTPPTTLIDDDVDIDLGDQAARLMYLGPAHTAGDLAVFLPESGVVFTGDVMFNQCAPVGWEGTFERWMSSLDRLIALEPSVVVPGHGPICGVDELGEMKAYLAYVLGEARTHYDAGLSTLDAARKIDLGRWATWDEPERLAFQVNRAYREFDGLPWDTHPNAMKVFGETAQLRGEMA